MRGGEIDDLFRVCVKIYASEHAVEDDAALFVPIFHDWIREGVLDLVMLDVADYAHAPDSPGIMLVCHEVSFSLDRTDGRFGLLAQRRIPIEGTPADAIAATISHVLEVGVRLERDPRVAGRLKLEPSTLRIEANDRLLAPNSEAGYEQFAPFVREGVLAAYGGGEPAVGRIENDPRDRLSVAVKLDAASDIQELLAALTPVLPGGGV